MWASLYTPVGKFKYEKLNYRITRLSTLLEELLSQDFSGYVEILAPHEHGLIVFVRGTAYAGFYEGTEELNLSQKEIIEHFLRTETTERETIINVMEIDADVMVALSALEKRTPAHRELETVFLDMGKLFETFARKKFTGVLRFYRIRNNTRLGNILLRLEKITAEQLRDAIRLQLSGEGALRLGDALKQIGAIDEKGIEEALDRQNVTRKGSDLELALAIFHDGEFLGGYRFSDKVLIKDRLEIIRWLGVSEILMDIIDGWLPQPLDIKGILHPGESPKAAQTATTEPGKASGEAASPEKSRLKNASDDVVIRELTHETFMLKADDLILDIHPHPAASAMDADTEEAADKNLSWLDELISQPGKEGGAKPLEEAKPAIPEGLAKAAERIITTRIGKDPRPVTRQVKPEASMEPAEEPQVKEPAPEEKQPQPPEQAAAVEPVAEELKPVVEENQTMSEPSVSPEPVAAAPASSFGKDTGIRALRRVADARMGFLGLALLQHEIEQMELPVDRPLATIQLKNLIQYFYHGSALVVGDKTAERIMIEMENEIGG